MKLSVTVLLILAVATDVLALPAQKNNDIEDGYSRRKHPEKVQQAMVEYWSNPEILPRLPPTVKEHVEKYITKFPEYQYKAPLVKAPVQNQAAPPAQNQATIPAQNRVVPPVRNRASPPPESNSSQGSDSCGIL
jgi:hypothetical protein